MNTEHTDWRETSLYPVNPKRQYSSGYLFAKMIPITQIPDLTVKHFYQLAREKNPNLCYSFN